MPNTVVELPESQKIPPRGAMIALRLIPMHPPMLRADTEARTVLWNVTGRDAGNWTQTGGQYTATRPATQAIAFAVTGQIPEVVVQIVGGLCKQFGWEGRLQPLADAERKELVDAGLPVPAEWNKYIQQGWREVPEDLYEFSAAIWAIMDAASQRDAALGVAQINMAAPEAKAAFLAALPPSLRIGPASTGEYQAACGARRTPGGPLLGEPCTTSGKCSKTRSGLCWHRWGLQREGIELSGAMYAGTVEVVPVAAPAESPAEGEGEGTVPVPPPKASRKPAKS